MSIKGKGKIYPSTPSTSSSSSCKDAMSVLKLQPASILELALSLSDQDRDVLAYMITRSITTTPSSSSIEHHKKNCKKSTAAVTNTGSNCRKNPNFQCGCFDCYTRFWAMWDSSPNRELIHQAIEAVEDHLSRSEFPKKNGRARKRDKLVGLRHDVGILQADFSPEKQPETTTEILAVPVASDGYVAVVEEYSGDVKENGCEEVEKKLVDDKVTVNFEMAAVTVQSPVKNHKGLARKVLPDVVGIFNSRFWSLWNPNI